MLPPQPPVTVCQRPGSRKRAAFARCRQEDHQDGDEDDKAGQEDHQDGNEDDEAGQEDHQGGHEDDGEVVVDDGEVILNFVSKVLSNKKCF